MRKIHSILVVLLVLGISLTAYLFLWFFENKPLSQQYVDMGIRVDPHDKTTRWVFVSEFESLLHAVALNMSSEEFHAALPEAIYSDSWPNQFYVSRPSEDFSTIYFDFTSDLSDTIHELRQYLIEKFPPEKVQNVVSMDESDQKEFMHLITNLQALEKEEKSEISSLYCIHMPVRLAPRGKRTPGDFDSRPLLYRYMKQWGKPDGYFVQELIELIEGHIREIAGAIWNRGPYTLILTAGYDSAQDRFKGVDIRFCLSYIPLTKIFTNSKIYPDDDLKNPERIVRVMDSFRECVAQAMN